MRFMRLEGKYAENFNRINFSFNFQIVKRAKKAELVGNAVIAKIVTQFVPKKKKRKSKFLF